MFFVDAAHFLWTAHLGVIWCFVRMFVPSPSGRKRFNVLGAVDAVTRELITVCNDGVVNSWTFCELLYKVAAARVGRPITFVLDNASYQKCALVERTAKSLGIHLLYLPAASPNLNIIERLWKFVKKECLYSKHHKTFIDFKRAIRRCLAGAHSVHRAKLASLLTLKFQILPKPKIQAA